MEGKSSSKIFGYKIRISLLEGDREVASRVIEPKNKMAVSNEVLKATWDLIKSIDK